MMRKTITIFVIGLLMIFALPAFGEEAPVTVCLNGQALSFNTPPVIVEGRTLVPVRAVTEAMGCVVTWNGNNQRIGLSNDEVKVTMKVGERSVNVIDRGENLFETVLLEAAPAILNETTYLPIRAVVEAFGALVSWDEAARTIGISYEAKPLTKPTFYFQNDELWELPNYGFGYCWVISYAMVLSDLLKQPITPVDVMQVNLTQNDNGAYCYHGAIVSTFGARLAPALEEDSPYLDHYDDSMGRTYLKKPEEMTEDELDLLFDAAIREAIDLHPEGVMVRFDDYPHTFVAISYDEERIYFNEPAQSGFGYDIVGSGERIPFEKTCLGQNYRLCDLTYLEALSE